jgi:hypothetical protein
MLVFFAMQQEVYRDGVSDCKTSLQMNIGGVTVCSVLLLTQSEFPVVVVFEIRRDQPNGEIRDKLLVQQNQFADRTAGHSRNANITLQIAQVIGSEFFRKPDT